MTRWPEASICAVMSLRSAFLAICLVALSTVTFAADPRVIETPQATPSAGVPPSTPSDQEKKSPGQHNTTQDNRGTEAVPLIVKELPRELSEKEKREAETKSILDHRLIEGTENLAKYTEYLFFATIMLAAGSGVLALVAYCQMRDARRAMSAAEASAKATERFAAISEREFVVAHRPKIILREAIIGSVLEGQPIAVIFTLANVGETPGTIVQSQVGVEIVNERVERPFFLGSVEPYNELGITLKPGEQQILHLPPGKVTPAWDPKIFGRQNNDVGSRSFSLHFYGQFIYSDATGIGRRTTFRRILRPERQRFYRIEHEPDLDYSD